MRPKSTSVLDRRHSAACQRSTIALLVQAKVASTRTRTSKISKDVLHLHSLRQSGALRSTVVYMYVWPLHRVVRQSGCGSSASAKAVQAFHVWPRPKRWWKKWYVIPFFSFSSFLRSSNINFTMHEQQDVDGYIQGLLYKQKYSSGI